MMTASVTGYAIVQGFASTLDTLLPPAWTSDTPHMVGLWTQRTGQSYITSLFSMPMLTYSINSHHDCNRPYCKLSFLLSTQNGLN